VDQEDRGHPLSDQQIAGALLDLGVAIARRTVAKYREELRILPARLRHS
jgi:RNA polymerase sigma-54 factor